MIEELIVYIQSIIAGYGAWGVFVATLIEEVISPIPSPLISLAAGFFLLSPELSLVEATVRSVLVIAVPVSIGISIGSAVVYAIGYFGGKPVIDTTKRWTGIKWEDIERVEARLTRGSGDEIALFVLRLIPIVPGVAVSGLAGIIRYPFRTFAFITFVGSFLRAFLLGLVGWQVGEVYMQYADALSAFEDHIFLGVLIAVLVLGFWYYFARSRNKKN